MWIGYWLKSLLPVKLIQILTTAVFFAHNFWSIPPIWELQRPFESSRFRLFKFGLFKRAHWRWKEKDVTFEEAKNSRFAHFFGGFFPPGEFFPLLDSQDSMFFLAFCLLRPPPNFLFYFEATNSLFSHIHFQLDQIHLFSTDQYTSLSNI